MNTNTHSNANTVEEIYTNGYLGLNPQHRLDQNSNTYVFNGYEYDTHFSDTEQHNITIGTINTINTIDTIDHIDLGMSFVQISDNPCIDAETLYLTGMELMDNQKHQEALEYLEQAYALGEPKCLGLIISCYVIMQDYQNASMYFDHFIKHDFQDKSLYFSLGNFYFVEAKITDCFDMRTEFFENALTCLTQCVSDTNTFPTLGLYIGLCYYHLNDYSQAISYLTLFVESNDVCVCTGTGTDTVEALKTLMYIYSKQNNVQKIIECFVKLGEVEQVTGTNVVNSFVDIFDNPDVLYALGTTATATATTTNTHTQILYLKKASDKAHVDACFVLAQHYSSINDFVNASKYYMRAYELGFTMCFNEMIRCWYKCGDFTHGEFVEKHCLADNADNWIVYDYMALGFCENDVEKAWKYVARLGGGSPTIYYVGTTRYETQHEHNIALEYYTKFFNSISNGVRVHAHERSYDHLLRLMALKMNDKTHIQVLEKFMQFIITNDAYYEFYELTRCSDNVKWRILNDLDLKGVLTGVYVGEFQRLSVGVRFGTIKKYMEKMNWGTGALFGLSIIGLIVMLRTKRFI